MSFLAIRTYNNMTAVRQIKSPAFSRAEPDARRQSLIEATALCLALYGAQGVSVRAICRHAGVSAGLLRHYFVSIDAAIEETYRQTGQRVQAALADAVARATEPRARLLAYVTASFTPPISDPQLLATWMAFWGLTKTSPAIAAIHTEIYAGYRSAMERLIAELAPAARDHRLTAVALTALVDGLWLELSLGDAPFTALEAAKIAARYVDALIN
jgi:TetR/AcrR family transcriptional regulator, transcriptional repressor of bet genes